MKLEKVGLLVGIVAGVVAIWYYLRGTPSANLVTYPNTQASGQPASENAGSTYNIAAPSPMPSPNLIYGAPPPLPTAPANQTYNYSPVNILGLTPQGATLAQGAPPVDKCCGGGGGGCGCASCAGGGTYQDGNQNACLVANPSEQIKSGTAAMFQAVADNIASSSVSNGGQPIQTPAPTPPPANAAAVVPAQAQAIAQGQVRTPASINPPLAQPLLSWTQFEILTAINSGAN